MNVKQKYFANRICIFSVLSFALFTFALISVSTANAPLMDIWRLMGEFIESIFMGGFSAADMWRYSAGHRYGVHALTFAANVYFFKMNVLAQIYGGFAVNIVTSVLMCAYYRAKIKNAADMRSSVKAQILFIPLLAAFFNPSQFEIVYLDFALSYALRKLVFLLMFYCVERVLLFSRPTGGGLQGAPVNSGGAQRLIPEISLAAALTILFISGGYAVCFAGTIFFCLFIALILNGKENAAVVLKRLCPVCLASAAALAIYFKGLPLSGLGSKGVIMHGILNGDMFRALALAFGASVLHPSIPVSNAVFAIVGIIIIYIYIYALYTYFRKKMYKDTYLPLMLMAYSAGCALVFFLTRYEPFGVSYLKSPRYTYDTSLGVVGALFITCKALTETGFNVRKIKSLIRVFPVVFILSALFASYSAECILAPRKKGYYIGLIEMMRNIDDYSDEALAPFQAPPQQVRTGVELMKKYKLGVFANP